MTIPSDSARFPASLASPLQQHPFQSGQIVCLQHGQTRLYAEVVDVVVLRQRCWVHPLALVSHARGSDRAEGMDSEANRCEVGIYLEPGGNLQWHDLRQDSDLLWPLRLFRLAYDTEVLPLLEYLYQISPPTHRWEDTKNKCFREFVRQVWQADPLAFRSEPVETEAC